MCLGISVNLSILMKFKIYWQLLSNLMCSDSIEYVTIVGPNTRFGIGDQIVNHPSHKSHTAAADSAACHAAIFG